MTLPKNSQEKASAPNLDELLRMQRQRQRQRQLQQESRSSVPDNEECGYLSSFTAAPRGPLRTARSIDDLRSILRRAVAIIDESDEETEDSVISSRRDDTNSQP
jgi:hypothetical protein